jgi:predicted NAD-dependent protein-ADP-ribosyltransferase YbiA (DUF1768 family)
METEEKNKLENKATVVWYGPKHVPSTTKGARGTTRFRHHPFENEYLCPVEHEGHTFPSAFHAYSAAKSTLSPVEFTRGSVRRARELVKGPMVPGFVDARVRVMRSILRSKFFRDPALARALLATGTGELRYDARGEPFWGYPGENSHGKILADLRLELAGIIDDRRRELEAIGAGEAAGAERSEEAGAERSEEAGAERSEEAGAERSEEVEAGEAVEAVEAERSEAGGAGEAGEAERSEEVEEAGAERGEAPEAAGAGEAGEAERSEEVEAAGAERSEAPEATDQKDERTDDEKTAAE